MARPKAAGRGAPRDGHTSWTAGCHGGAFAGQALGQLASSRARASWRSPGQGWWPAPGLAEEGASNAMWQVEWRQCCRRFVATLTARQGILPGGLVTVRDNLPGTEREEELSLIHI
eukprot:1820111-Alexandrium_andersonii.AAC.1